MAARRSGSAPEVDPLTVEVVDLIGSVVARYYQEYDLAAAQHSLTGAQARVLALLAREPLPMRQVARRLKCEPSNVTGIVDRLQARGLVERRASEGDRRIKLAAATEAGQAVAAALRGSLDFAREPLAELTLVERTLLRDLLIRMLGEDPALDDLTGRDPERVAGKAERNRKAASGGRVEEAPLGAEARDADPPGG